MPHGSCYTDLTETTHRQNCNLHPVTNPIDHRSASARRPDTQHILIGDCDDGVLQSRDVEENDVLWRYAADRIARQEAHAFRHDVAIDLVSALLVISNL